MKIRSLQVEGFGHFADRQIGPFDRPVTIFHGSNEAGKSTLLEFIKRVLYGFRSARGRPPADYNDYPPLVGGSHGGSATFVTDGGEIFTVRRVVGRGAGSVTLTSAAGETIPEVELSRLLGNHPKDVFESVFAFTLDELHNGDLLTDSNVNSQIYSVGMGAMKLPDALKTLSDQKVRLFLKGGSRHAIHAAAGRLEAITAKLREVESNAAEYRLLSARLREIERELIGLRDRRLKSESGLEEHRRLQRAWDDWIDLAGAEQRLATIPEIDELPEGGASLLEKLEERARTARGEYELAVENVESAEGKVATHIEHKSILEQEDAIRDIQQGRNGFDQSVKDVPERKAELEVKRVDLKNALADLGEGWDAERVNGFDLSIVVREEVATYGERLRAARDDFQSSQSALGQAETALADAFHDVERSQSSIDNAPKPTLNEDAIRDRRGRIRRARDRLDDFARTEERVNDLRDRLDSGSESDSGSVNRNGSKMVAAALAAVGIALAAAGALLGEQALVFGLVAGVSLLAVAVYLFVRGGLSDQIDDVSMGTRHIHERLREAEERLSDLQDKLDDEASALGIDGLDRDSLNEAEQALDTEQARLNEWVTLTMALEEAKGRAERLTARRDASEQAVENALSALESTDDQWKRWLAESGLHQSFSPDSIEELRRLVDLGRTHHKGVVEMEKRIEAIATDIREFTEFVQSLAAAYGFDLDTANHARVGAVADDLIELHREVSERARKWADAKEDLRTARKERDRREKLVRDAEREIQDLVMSGGAKNAEDFRRRAQAYDDRQEVKSAIDAALNNLRRISGPGEALDTLRARLDKSSAQTIGDDIRLSEANLAEIDEKIEELATERGSVRRALDEMLGEEDSSKLRAERHILLEQIRGHAREWVVRTIAENLLKEAQTKFEKERQPDVVRHAAAFFKDITGERYGTVFSPVGRPEIHVTDSAGISKQPQQLSRGTREQLFLSLRFGLVRDMGQRSERLPVIVDEALVNFDPDRGLRAAGAFVELAQTNQVLVFTCHPQIVDRFVSAASERGAQPPEIIEIGEAVS